jgi:hypothetical protein
MWLGMIGLISMLEETREEIVIGDKKSIVVGKDVTYATLVSNKVKMDIMREEWEGCTN